MSQEQARTGANAYGYFDDVTREYVITRSDAPTPWLVVPLSVPGTTTVKVEVVLR